MIMPVFMLALAACAVSRPFAGPGYDRERGVIAPDTGAMVVVALTNATLDGARRHTFDDHTRRVVDSLSSQPGFIGSSLRTRIFGNEVWTMTAWTSEEALDNFVASGVHQTAIENGMAPVRTARFARIKVARTALPLSWDRALEILETQGTGYAY
ncbi:MAG: antibiotic biosynthesis monooxygenase [Kofleriaceae bacterium]|nr:antibiotic biosynthesis monooxygenase [Kofleriaceae bacterium]